MKFEALASKREELLANISMDNECDILCIQETHRGLINIRPRVPEMALAIERSHEKYESAITEVVREGLIEVSTSLSTQNNIEFLRTSLYGPTIAYMYKPTAEPYCVEQLPTNQPRIVIGDFISHSSNWGYDETNADGKAVKK